MIGFCDVILFICLPIHGNLLHVLFSIYYASLSLDVQRTELNFAKKKCFTNIYYWHLIWVIFPSYDLCSCCEVSIDVKFGQERNKSSICLGTTAIKYNDIISRSDRHSTITSSSTKAVALISPDLQKASKDKQKHIETIWWNLLAYSYI